MSWVQHNLISELAGVPVYSPGRPWPYPHSSAFYSTGDDVHAGPYIMLRAKYAVGIKRTVRGNPGDLWLAARSWKTLSNEVAHARGLDATDIGGFDGGVTHNRTILRLMRELMGKAGVNPRLQRVLVRRAAKTFGTITNPVTPAMPPPLPPGTIPTIGG